MVVKEFYEIRANITKYLIINKQYNIILFESDWLHIFDLNNYILSNNFNLYNKNFNSSKEIFK